MRARLSALAGEIEKVYRTALAWGGPRRRDIIAIMMGLAALLAACGVLAPASTGSANVWVDCAGGRDGSS